MGQQQQQYVGIDLHRRRSVIVRRTPAGETLETVRIDNDPMQAASGGDNSISAMQNAMPVDILEPEDIADAVAFLVSDRAKWITGVLSLPVDAGFCVR